MDALPESALFGILSNVDDGASLVNASLVCKRWRSESEFPVVWESLARKLYPPQTLNIGLYNTWMDLVRDHNRRGAMPTRRTPKRSCQWIWNRPGMFYMCKIDALKWDRCNEKLRMYIDARGEPDLRLPVTSSLKILLVGGDFSSIAICIAPESFQAEVYTPGHFRGYLTWDVGMLEQILPKGDRAMQAVVSFCYANNPAQGWMPNDYNCEKLLEVPDTSRGLVHGMFDGCPYEHPFSPYAGESPENEATRWSDAE